ncbi:Gamma-interferon-inducible protein 16 [Saguinus oedipus]|uniref:Gamma-interferon-inducible protein 16 n=1 Tax=Saguinus oedipus TaxID=9490 RepID=A0ABQ9TID7_SAGOE|nr:Gamma-interferon-inducible protein 16 [Saguinus oedipus]
MGKKYKNIVLLKGLEGINDYHFRMVKSLLSSDLKLNPKMRDEYDKIQIADLLEERFPGDAGLGKLIQIIKEIPTLGDFAETLKKEKLKAQGHTPTKKRKKEIDPAVPAPSAISTVTAKGAEATPGGQTETKKSRKSQEQIQPPCPAGASMFTAVGHFPSPQPSPSAPPNAFSTESPKTVAKRLGPAKRNIPQKGPVIVKVLSATKPFGYETPEKEKKIMFHATVATPTQFFHVKVLNINLKEKFSGKKIIAISDYLEYDNLLEVNEGSSVSEAGPDQKLEVPNKIISRAKETLKIDILHKQASGNTVYGIFTLHKQGQRPQKGCQGFQILLYQGTLGSIAALEKEVNHKQKSTTYEIEDDRGKMDVVGTGQCHDIPCEDGDKLHLFCFRLRKKNQMKEEKKEKKVVKERKKEEEKEGEDGNGNNARQVKKKPNPRNYAPKSMKLPQEQSQLLNTSEASTTLPESHPQTPQMPPITASTSSVIKPFSDGGDTREWSESVRIESHSAAAASCSPLTTFSANVARELY